MKLNDVTKGTKTSSLLEYHCAKLKGCELQRYNYGGFIQCKGTESLGALVVHSSYVDSGCPRVELNPLLTTIHVTLMMRIA